MCLLNQDRFKAQFQTVQILLAKRAKINDQGELGYTPLMLAVKQNNSSLVKLLLQYGADKNMKRANGESALTIAGSLNHAEIKTLLLK